MKSVKNDQLPLLLLLFLETYPQTDPRYIKVLISHPKTRKIVKAIKKNEISTLKPEDFEKISKNAQFLQKCAHYLAVKGEKSGNIETLEFVMILCQNSRIYAGDRREFSIGLAMEADTRHILANLSIAPFENLNKAIELYQQARSSGFDRNTPNYAATLTKEGNIRKSLADHGIEPVENLKRAIELQQRARAEGFICNTPEFAQTFINEGIAWLHLADLGIEPVESLNKAIELQQRARAEGFIGNTPDFARTFLNEGIAWLHLADLGIEPVKNLNKAIELQQRARAEGFIGNTPDFARTFLNEGIAWLHLADLGIGTIENLNKAIELQQRARNEGLLINTISYGRTFINEGVARKNLAILGKAPAENQEIAIELFQRARNEGIIKNTIDFAASLNNEGNARQNLAMLGIAPFENLKIAIELFQRARNEGFTKNTIDFAEILVNEGNARKFLATFGIFPIENLNEAVRLYERARGEGLIEKTPGYAKSLTAEGVARQNLANLGIEPIKNLSKSIELFERARCEGLIANTPDYASSQMAQGIALRSLAEIGTAPVENLTQAINLFEKAGVEGYLKNTPEYAATLILVGNAYMSLVDLGIDPIENSRKSIDFFRRATNEGVIKNTPDYAGVLVNEGIVWKSLADLGIIPIENLNKAAELFGRARNEGFSPNTPDFARTLGNEAGVLLRLANLDIDPIANLHRAITLFEKARIEGFLENTPDFARALLGEGGARQHLLDFGVAMIENSKVALSCLLEAKRIFINSNDRINLVKVYTSAGLLKYRCNEMHGAYTFFKEAIDLIEGIRTSFVAPNQRKEYFETVTTAYTKMTITCLALREIEKDKAQYWIESAFFYSESSKGRAFLDLVTYGKKKMENHNPLIRKYHLLLQKIDEQELLLSRADCDILKKQAYDLLNKIQETDPEYYSVQAAKPIKLDDLFTVLKEKTLIQYFIGDKLVIFIVKNGNLSVIIPFLNGRPVSDKEIQTQNIQLLNNIHGCRNAIKNKDTKTFQKVGSEVTRLLDWYSNALIEPVSEYLTEEIIIVPHRYLHFVPFQAMKHGDRYLIEDHIIQFAQSASSLKFLKRRNGIGALVIGNPTKDLSYSEIEACEVARILHVTPLLKDEAKKGRILDEIEGKKILHFACHGMFDPIFPSFSKIILSDGSITAAEFMDLNLDTDLTVLSACATALAPETRGDEVEGLIRAIQYSGGRFVIASLWNVEDESTMELFQRFYSSMGEKTEETPKKMRDAEMEFVKRGMSFYSWAPFQVYGI